MSLIIKTQNKAEAEQAQRRYYWSLTPRERLEVARRLNEQARAICAANPANLPLTTTQAHGGSIYKSATPVPRRGR